MWRSRAGADTAVPAGMPASARRLGTQALAALGATAALLAMRSAELFIMPAATSSFRAPFSRAILRDSRRHRAGAAAESAASVGLRVMSRVAMEEPAAEAGRAAAPSAVLSTR